MVTDVAFIVGRNGAGKSEYIRSMIEKQQTAGERSALIVPEQFTFETERELARTLGCGLINVYVLSFTSLARKVLFETGCRTVFLTRQGRRMIIRKAIIECRDSLRSFSRAADKSGFAKECDQLFLQFKRCGIRPDALREAALKLDDSLLLKDKLYDLALVYEAAEKYLVNRFMDGEDAFSLMAENFKSSSYADMHIYIDGFDMLSKEIYHALDAMLDSSRSLTFALSGDLDAGSRDRSVFLPERGIMERLMRMLEERGTRYSVTAPPREFSVQGQRTEALRWLEHEAFARPYRPFSGEPAGIRVFAATKRAAEADAVADEILALARRGVRFSEIAVVATDMEAYLSVVSRALRKRGIAFFTDMKHPFSEYALSRFTLASLCAASRGFPARDVVDAVKTGLFGIDDDAADELENYALAYGVRGTALTRPFTRGDVTEGAERARATVMPYLMELRDSLAAADDVAQKTDALFQFLSSTGVRERLIALTEELKAEGRLELAEESAQAFNTLVELLTQLRAVMGDVTLSSREYTDIIEEGFSSYEIGVIPTTADQVLFGSIGRTRARAVRALFVMGASEGCFPKYVSDDALIDDRELRRMGEMGFTTWDTTRDKCARENYDVYGAVAKPTELLFISYPTGSDAGSGTECALITHMRAIFQGLVTENDLDSPACRSKESAFALMAGGLRGVADGTNTAGYALTSKLYSYFMRDEASAARLHNVESALYYSPSPAPIGEAAALSLYCAGGSGSAIYGSASRLETFNSCPFSHFAQYGLRARARREFREQRADEGEFCHEALARFTEALLSQKKSFSDVTEEDCAAILDDIFPELIATHNNGILMETARMRALLSRLVARIKATAWAITRQLAHGGFRPAGTEVVFGSREGATLPALTIKLKNGREFRLSGKIDRLDSYVSPAGDKYIRIIDYKTGSAQFSFTDLLYGLKLQLPLYIDAALAADKAANAAGMYYQPVREPYADEDDADTAAALEKTLISAFRLSGISLCEPVVLPLLTGDGEIPMASTRSGVLDAREVAAVVRFGEEAAAKTAESILTGNVEACPVKDACAYCDFKNACGFDAKLEGFSVKPTPTMAQKAFIEHITQNGGQDGGDEE